jgi:hypothetical protein
MPPPLVPLGELGTEPFASGSGGSVNKPASGSQATAVAVSVASPLLNWLTSPEPFTYCKVQGQRSPGFIPTDGGISGFEREEKWDVKSGKGTKGATTTRVAMEPAKGSITFWLPNSDSIARWSAFLALFRFDTSKKKGEAVSIYHPTLVSVQPPITSVVMTKHSPVYVDSKGLGVVKLELLEYFPETATTATTASGSKGGTGAQYASGNPTGKQEDPAIAKMKAQVAALQKQLGGTA